MGLLFSAQNIQDRRKNVLLKAHESRTAEAGPCRRQSKAEAATGKAGNTENQGS